MKWFNTLSHNRWLEQEPTASLISVKRRGADRLRLAGK